MVQLWKDIKGYEGLYQISNLGYVKALRYGNQKKSNKEKIMKASPDGYGYLQLGLTKDKKTTMYKIHRLVAEAFIPNENNLPQINHKDENKVNNKVDNLEWCTLEYNINYGSRTEKYRKKIKQYDLSGNLIKIWNSITDIEKELKIPHSHIVECCKGKRPTAKKYIWKYKEG